MRKISSTYNLTLTVVDKPLILKKMYLEYFLLFNIIWLTDWSSLASGSMCSPVKPWTSDPHATIFQVLENRHTSLLRDLWILGVELRALWKWGQPTTAHHLVYTSLNRAIPSNMVVPRTLFNLSLNLHKLNKAKTCSPLVILYTN